MRFEVKALTSRQHMQVLQVEAESEADARRQVENQQLLPVTLRPLRAKSNYKGGSRRKGFSLLLFSQELLALLSAGLSLVESIEALLEKEGGTEARHILSSIQTRMREGLRFSEAVSQHPVYFPVLYVGIIKAAERTSDLPQALGRYIDYQSRMEGVRTRIISATIYPCILFIVGGGVSLFLMGFVVPRFAAVYQGSGRQLPFMSQLLLDWGGFVGTHTRWVVLALVVLLAGLIDQIRRISREGRWKQIASRIPFLAEQAYIMELSRLYLTLGMLLEGGIPILQAMDMVSSAISPPMRENLAMAKNDISYGGQLSQAFESHDLTTSISLRMLRVGEKSGQLGAMLTRSALFYEGESARWIERFSKTFEPVLMALIGLVIGFIVVLLYMPIFDLAGSLQ